VVAVATLESEIAMAVSLAVPRMSPASEELWR
jgi:hypothetical protein